MSTIIIVLAIYLAVGIIALIMFDLVTKRLRRRLRDAAYDAQLKLEVGTKASIILTVLALWIFWPAPICGALYDWVRGNS